MRVFGTNEDYDRGELVEWGAVGLALRALLARGPDRADRPARVLKDHDLAGVSLAMKNWYGVVHNPNKLHDDDCDPFVADLVGCTR